MAEQGGCHRDRRRAAWGGTWVVLDSNSRVRLRYRRLIATFQRLSEDIRDIEGGGCLDCLSQLSSQN